MILRSKRIIRSSSSSRPGRRRTQQRSTPREEESITVVQGQEQEQEGEMLGQEEQDRSSPFHGDQDADAGRSGPLGVGLGLPALNRRRRSSAAAIVQGDEQDGDSADQAACENDDARRRYFPSWLAATAMAPWHGLAAAAANRFTTRMGPAVLSLVVVALTATTLLGVCISILLDPALGAPTPQMVTLQPLQLWDTTMAAIATWNDIPAPIMPMRLLSTTDPSSPAAPEGDNNITAHARLYALPTFGKTIFQLTRVMTRTYATSTMPDWQAAVQPIYQADKDAAQAMSNFTGAWGKLQAFAGNEWMDIPHWELNLMAEALEWLQPADSGHFSDTNNNNNNSGEEAGEGQGWEIQLAHLSDTPFANSTALRILDSANPSFPALLDPVQSIHEQLRDCHDQARRARAALQTLVELVPDAQAVARAGLKSGQHGNAGDKEHAATGVRGGGGGDGDGDGVDNNKKAKGWSWGSWTGGTGGGNKENPLDPETQLADMYSAKASMHELMDTMEAVDAAFALSTVRAATLIHHLKAAALTVERLRDIDKASRIRRESQRSMSWLRQHKRVLAWWGRLGAAGDGDDRDGTAGDDAGVRRWGFGVDDVWVRRGWQGTSSLCPSGRVTDVVPTLELAYVPALESIYARARDLFYLLDRQSHDVMAQIQEQSDIQAQQINNMIQKDWEERESSAGENGRGLVVDPDRVICMDVGDGSQRCLSAGELAERVAGGMMGDLAAGYDGRAWAF